MHISELAWQRIDNPREVIKPGEKIKAEIIDIDNSKISLSIKKLLSDPWKDIEKKYKPGQTVEGTVLKVNPFGLFVELDEDIHGLAHISELSSRPIQSAAEIAKPGDKLKFKIISVESEDHRLGLSIKGLDDGGVKDIGSGKKDKEIKKPEIEKLEIRKEGREKRKEKIDEDVKDEKVESKVKSDDVKEVKTKEKKDVKKG